MERERAEFQKYVKPSACRKDNAVCFEWSVQRGSQNSKIILYANDILNEKNATFSRANVQLH